jgi:hypothetical protein
VCGSASAFALAVGCGGSYPGEGVDDLSVEVCRSAVCDVPGEVSP